MFECEQTKGMSVWEHGLSVWLKTEDIMNKDLEGFKCPVWLIEHYDKILENMHHWGIVRAYNVYHDCGKPYCFTVDDEGKRHFPNHAEVSAKTWLDDGGDPTIGNLIGMDMVLHTETADQIKDRNLDIKDAMTLLITALAEIHSNAEMFGGIDSISFKSKWKKIDRRGKMLMKEYF